MQTFTERVLNIVQKIPKGSTMTYKQVATMAGSPGAARAVGSIMKANYRANVPCHRVVRSNGTVGNYNRGGAQAKAKLLKKEGVIK